MCFTSARCYFSRMKSWRIIFVNENGYLVRGEARRRCRGRKVISENNKKQECKRECLLVLMLYDTGVMAAI